MIENRIQNILEEIYKLKDYNLYDVISFIIDQLRKLEELLSRALSTKEVDDGIDSALIYLISNK